MNDIRDQFHRAAGDDDRSLDPAAMADLASRARSRRTRQRVGMASLGLAAVALLGVGVASAGGDHPGRQQLTASAGDGVADTSSTSTTTTDPIVTLPADPSASTSTVVTETSIPATTTTVPGSTTTEAPDASSTTTAPASDPGRQLSISGTFRGTSPIISGGSGRCEELNHQFDATVWLSSHETWALHEDYCGWLDGSMWNGKGTFTMTADTGDTLTGTFTSRAPIPTSGEPYQLTITGGTGRYASASGTCNIDNHLRQAGAGMQEQFGTFTCDAALSPAASVDQ